MNKKTIVAILLVLLISISGTFALGIEVWDSISSDAENYIGAGVTYGETRNYGFSTGLLLYTGYYTYSTYNYDTDSYYYNNNSTFCLSVYEKVYYNWIFQNTGKMNTGKFNMGLDLAASIWAGYSDNTGIDFGIAPEVGLKFGIIDSLDLTFGYKFILDSGNSSVIANSFNVVIKYHFNYKGINTATGKTWQGSNGNILPNSSNPNVVVIDEQPTFSY